MIYVNGIKRLAAVIIIFVIRIYQKLISPLLGKNCRFYPTCSEYSVLAIKKYGPFKGSYIAVKRILRCNPFNEGGYDPLS
ncbi:hypothetical protein SAMN02745945_02461 [Peptoclostridium litorale DSM 5388]|uniref:Putative membrane protein insertion efficiency factor n=1 Tax=Peptoclostridium litorale DSM 5388 TaxID=1121324 RepID=A0A069RH59_PEPLI|nr:membrane protein insertion efficiency factor YidD [Peptoclostridium litorale]KDR96379.1 hypothetical protein CLIT_4c02170 [Peptoclostridium litorale DSM 5388]SIO27263.1 hypothetical protein SAMN02745945_02461 [Peptoclostridium litorale DSM 5388]